MRKVVRLEDRADQLSITSKDFVEKLTCVTVVVGSSVAQAWRRIVQHLARINSLKVNELLIGEDLGVRSPLRHLILVVKASTFLEVLLCKLSLLALHLPRQFYFSKLD